MKTYYSFQHLEIPSLGEVGGKAKALIETSQAGFPVPPGFVLTVDFFSPWVEAIKKSSAWTEFLKATAENESAIKTTCDAVKQLCAHFTLTEDQQRDLNDAMAEFNDEDTFAVRSSSPEEDLEGASFAGGYETTLGVTGDSLREAILTSFQSMLDERIVKYKQQHNMAVDNPLIAVVVQKQIASDISGVAFSLNPRNNAYDEVVINANFGLGESIVSGLVTPDTYVVEKIENKILEKKIAQKSYALWMLNDGGTRETPNKQPEASSLTDAQILEITGLVTKTEEHYGKPMDIEWAIEDDNLYLLQSRPITTHLPLFPEMVTAPGEEKYLYMDVLVLSQGFSDPLSVLGGEIWALLLEKAKGETMVAGKDGLLWNIHGRQYLHLSNMMKGLGAKSLKKLMESYDAPTRAVFAEIDIEVYTPAQKTEKMRGYTWRVIKYMFGKLPGLWRGIFHHQQAIENYKKTSEMVFTYCKTELAKDKPFETLVKEGFASFGAMIDSATMLVGFMIARWRLAKMFRGENVDDLLVALNMDLPGNPTSEMGHFMCRLAAFPEVQKTADGEVFAEKLQQGGFSKEFRQAYEEYMERFGCRGIKEIDIASPRAYENPAEFFEHLKQINIEHNATTTVKQRSRAAYDELLAISKRLGKEKKFKRYARINYEVAGYREHPKYIYVVLNDMLRRRALFLGRRFKEQERLDEVEHVFDLTIAQIGQAEADSSLDLRSLRETNLAPRRPVEHIKDWPRIIDSRGKIFRVMRQRSDGDFVGDAISPGVVRGRAKVLNSPYEKPLEKGEILVTRATEPSWTPIFINAAGVVLEVGGPLQHGAIIAREYGIPCVSGLEMATKEFQDGDELEVDGSSGLVKVIG